MIIPSLTVSSKKRGATMGKKSKGAVVRVLSSASYEENNGMGIYDAHELERQDKANEKALEALDKRYGLPTEYDGTKYAELYADERERLQDPNEEMAFYPQCFDMDKKGTIITWRTNKCFNLKMDGDKRAFLKIGGDDIMTIGKDLPLTITCPSGVKLMLHRKGKVACLIIKGAKGKEDFTFNASSAIYFSYIRPKGKTPLSLNMG